MANPQPDQFTRISNELYEAIIGFNLTGYQQKVLHSIIRKTYGYGKKTDKIPLSQLSNLTGIAKPHISRAIRELVGMKIVTTDGNKMGINKDYESWLKVTTDGNNNKNQKLPPMVMTVTTDGNKSLPPAAPQKKYKETIKEINTGNASPEFFNTHSNSRYLGFQSIGQVVTGDTRVSTQAQEEALRFAKELKIDLSRASKHDPSLRSRWFKLFKDAHINKNTPVLHIAYSYYKDMPSFSSKTDMEKIKLFFWKFNNPYQTYESNTN